MEHIKEISKKDIERAKKEKLRKEAEEKRLEEEERKNQFEASNKQNKAKRQKIFIISGSVLALIIISIAIFTVINSQMPGPFDNFARCLTEKGAIAYGAMSWCTYTQEQAGMFGKSFKHINYKEYTELPGIKYTPTWVIDEKWYEKVQSFETLAAVTGCDWNQ
jgi:hypothetical protein